MAPRELSRDDVQRLYETHARVLFAYGRSLVGEAASAEDLLHQVFARLLQGDIAVDGRPLAYLCRAVRNAAFNAAEGVLTPLLSRRSLSRRPHG